MIKLRLERGWSFDGYQLWIMDYRGEESYVAKPITLEFVKVPFNYQLPEPTLLLPAMLGNELLCEARKTLAGYSMLDDKEDYEISKRVEKEMKAHIDSLKLVIDRTLK